MSREAQCTLASVRKASATRSNWQGCGRAQTTREIQEIILSIVASEAVIETCAITGGTMVHQVAAQGTDTNDRPMRGSTS